MPDNNKLLFLLLTLCIIINITNYTCDDNYPDAIIMLNGNPDEQITAQSILQSLADKGIIDRNDPYLTGLKYDMPIL